MELRHFKQVGCAIYPLYFAFAIDGASLEIEPSTLGVEYIL